MWEVGFWLHWQLWGTEVSQSRKWLDLPCGRLAHPDNSPHSFEHPGSPPAPTEGSEATADHPRARKSAGPGSKDFVFGRCFVTKHNSTLDKRDCEWWVSKSRCELHHCYSYFCFVRDNWQQPLICHTGIMCCQLLHCTTGSWSNSLSAKKYEYSFKQTNYVSARGTFNDCSNKSPLLVAYLFSEFIYCRYKALLNSYMTLWIYLVLQRWNNWTIGQNWRRSQVIGIAPTFYEVVVLFSAKQYLMRIYLDYYHNKTIIWKSGGGLWAQCGLDG